MDLLQVFNGGPCNLEMQAWKSENIHRAAEDVLSFVKRGWFQKSLLNMF